MGKRDLLMIALVLAGGAVLAQTISTPAAPSAASSARATVEAPRWSADVVASARRIDAALRAQWQTAGIEPLSAVDPLAVARRLSLALAGTVPSLAEIRWLESLPEEGRIAAWTEHLLADRRTDDYLAERLARATVGSELGPFFVYRRRRFVSWLSDQLRENRPYDELVRELIAAEGLWTERPATNFITVAIVQPSNDLDETRLAGSVARAFLGVRMDCAGCHDHPHARWKQENFHALAAFFGVTRQAPFTGIRDGRGHYEYEPTLGQKTPLAPAVPFAAELLPDEGRRRERLAHWVTHRDNPAFARATANRVWSWLFGRPLVEPVDDIPMDGPLPPVLETLATEFRDGGFDLKRLIRAIAATEAFRLDSRLPDEDSEASLDDLVAAQAAFPLTPLRAEQVAGSLLQSASLQTLDSDSPILLRFARQVDQSQFIARYGDPPQDDPSEEPQTIPRRLVLLNGMLVGQKAKADPANTVTRAALLSPDDETAIEIVYLTVLTRRPTAEEATHFLEQFKGRKGHERQRTLEDLFVVLLNSTEFLCNH